MQIVHSIRLKGPWDYLREGGESPAAGRIKLPACWSDCFGDWTGAVAWTRRFQRPTNLDPTERVLLCSPPIEGLRKVLLNDVELPLPAELDREFRIDLTARLTPSNLLTIVQQLETATADSSTPAPVVLEIWRVEA